MLYLIWVIFCACWHEGDTNVSEVYYRFFDFCDATDQCLRAAGLPELYPPHILEQTIFTSIVCAYKNEQIHTHMKSFLVEFLTQVHLNSIFGWNIRSSVIRIQQKFLKTPVIILIF